MTQNKPRYVVFARPKDLLIVEEFQNISSLTTFELMDYLKMKKEEEFLAIHTPYFLQALNPSSHPFEEYLNVIRDRKPESRYCRPDFYIAILPFSECDDKDLTIYVDVEILNPKKDKNEEEELTIPPFPVSFQISDIKSYDELKKIIISKFPFHIKVGETPRFSINIPKDGDSNTDYHEFDLSDENTGEFPRPHITDFLDSYLNKNRIKISCIIDDKSLTKIKHRVSIIKEIKTTEETFINGLNDLLAYYQAKFKEHKMLSDEEDQRVFKNVPLIIAAHKTLLGELVNAKQTYASNLSYLFIDFSNYFKVSKLYISQYSGIIQMFLEKNKDKDFARKFKEISKNHIELNSLLITPVQRMPRYILFLRELIKFTPPSHPDASLLKTAEKFLQEVTLDIEKASTEAENQALTSTIQDKIGKEQFVVIKPDRICILTIKIKFYKPKSGPGMLYLFNDLILIVSERENSEISNNSCQVLLAQTPIEFKFSLNPGSGILFMLDNNPISQDVSFSRSPSIPQFSIEAESSENNDKKEKKGKHDKREKEKEKKKEEEKREKEKKKQRLALIDFVDESEQEQFIKELYKLRAAFYNKLVDKRSFFKFNALNLLAESNLFYSDVDGCYNYDKNILYIFGGYPFHNDLLMINTDSGSVLNLPTNIPPRMSHTMTYYESAEEKDCFLIIFGGKGEGNEPLNDLWRIKLSDNSVKEIEVKSTIEPRYGHSAVIINDRLYIFGGMNKKKVLNDLCSVNLCGKIKSWQPQQPNETFPPPRAFHSSALINDEWYIFGGTNDKKASVFSSKQNDDNDYLYQLNFEKGFKKIELPTFPNRAWHRLVAVGSFLVIMGGLRELDEEPTIVYDTKFGKVFNYAASFNYPPFLTSFYCCFVNPIIKVSKNTSAAGFPLKVTSSNAQETNYAKREMKWNAKPHLLVFGGVNPLTKDTCYGLYEVKLPSIITDRLEVESKITDPIVAARKREPKGVRNSDSIPIGSDLQPIQTKRSNMQTVNPELMGNNKKSIAEMAKEARNLRLLNKSSQQKTNPPLPHPKKPKLSVDDNRKTENLPDVEEVADQRSESENKSSQPESSSESDEESPKENQSNPEPEPVKQELEPVKQEPEPVKQEPEPVKQEPEPVKQEPEPEPAKQEQDQSKQEVEPVRVVSSSIAARMAIFNSGSQMPKVKPQTPSSSITQSVEESSKAIPATQPVEKTSSTAQPIDKASSIPSTQPEFDFDEKSFCDSIGIDPSKLIPYQHKVLTSKLIKLYALKNENREIESQIAENQTSKGSILHHEAFNYYGKVFVNKKFVKIIEFNSNSNVNEIKEQIKSNCPNANIDSLAMFASNRKLNDAIKEFKETSQVELALILNSVSEDCYSHVNFVFQ